MEPQPWQSMVDGWIGRASMEVGGFHPRCCVSACPSARRALVGCVTPWPRNHEKRHGDKRRYPATAALLSTVLRVAWAALGGFLLSEQA